MSAITVFTKDFAFLSNFYPSELSYDGITWPTAEHAFQGMKSLDVTYRAEIATAHTPGYAKQLGRKVQLRDDWDVLRDSIMAGIVAAKFKQNTSLQGLLLLTGQRELVEGNNWHDTYWGKCVCISHQGRGQNRLGAILMSVRHSIRTANLTKHALEV